jgi:lipoprotein-anchoring transpeptidase ErfK/SrfK
MRFWLLVLAIAAASAAGAPAFAQPVPNPGQAALKLDTEMDAGTGALEDAFVKRPVYYRTNEPPGTIIVDTSERFLYLIKGNGTAIRYGIGVGRDGFQWAGLLRITRKAEWPDWTPPDEMIDRQPYLPRWMAGGPGNPLGARAMYLGGTVYRIHGTNQPETIGHAVSSGCFRLVNDDVIDLYNQVAVGNKVIVRH